MLILDLEVLMVEDFNPELQMKLVLIMEVFLINISRVKLMWILVTL